MQHGGSNPSHPGWTRTYDYSEISLLEDGASGTPAKNNNRLSGTSVSGNAAAVERYVYDAHANTTRMPHLAGADPDANVHWDFRDQPRQIDLAGGGKVYYSYDANGERVRKVCEKSANLVEERIYLEGFEIFRRRQGAERFERETLHIMDDKQRIALVETRTRDTAGADPAPAQVIRFQLGNHLSSAILELDDQAQIISYEEYSPYGSSTYQAVRSVTETSKRYRFTGKERDDESGFYYHHLRYYLPWLGRWLSADPTGLGDGVNVFSYVSNSPINLVDSQGSNGHPNPLDYSSFEEYVEAAEQGSQANLPRDQLQESWDQALASDRANQVSVTDVTSLARAEAARQFQRDLQTLRNIRTPALAFIMPAHVQPYLRDQAAGIRDPYLRFLGGLNQRGGMAVARFTNRLAAATIITYGAGMVATAAAPIIFKGMSGGAVLAGGARLLSAYRASSLFITTNYARIAAALTAGGAASRSPIVRTAFQNVWALRPFQRGRAIEAALTRILPGNAMRASNFPTIDMWVRGANNMASRITSIKSIDLAAKTYTRGNAVFNRLNQYLNSLSNFAGRTWGGETVRVGSNTVRVLEVAIPPNVATPAQLAQIQRAAQQAQQMGITLNVRIVQ